MSNSISEELSVSSSNNNTGAEFCLGVQTSNFTTLTPLLSQQQPVKRKRNLPGNPDPQAEVIALSPKTLMATNRFICEICKKGFQRDQNLQLHRRGHNLPWKLRQRTGQEMKKRVYVCPEPSCIHHEPSRALGDLTGIKKHFCRKHGEKKWKCEKCSKRYAVQSDWKAHSKTCGTREYRCSCGTSFSRKDSFISHRAFCDALAAENARLSAPLNFPSLTQEPNLIPKWTTQVLHPQDLPEKPDPMPSSLLLVPDPFLVPSFTYPPQDNQQPQATHVTSNPFSLPPFPHTSATALLHKVAEMDAILNNPNGSHLANEHFIGKDEEAAPKCMQEVENSHDDMEEGIAELVSGLTQGEQGGSINGEVVTCVSGDGFGSLSAAGSVHDMWVEKERCKRQFTRDFLGGPMGGLENGSMGAYGRGAAVSGFYFSPAARSWESS